MLSFAPLQVRVSTPRIGLVGATDDLLGQLQPLVRDGKATADPAPFDDPMSLYEEDPAVRVHKWLQGVWRGRGSVTPESWRLSFAVVLDGQPVGMQELIGDHFDTYGTVVSVSWLSSDVRRRGIGTEMRQAILHLAFEALTPQRPPPRPSSTMPAPTAYRGRLGTRRTALIGRLDVANQACFNAGG